MFNDLNQNNNQPAGQTPPVDDIFAETDKSVETKNFSGYYNQGQVTMSAPSEIETLKTGLSASDKNVSSKGKILKVVLIALLIILLIGLVYLVYVKFLTGQEDDVLTTNNVTATNTAVSQNEVILETDNVATQTVPVSEELAIVTSTPITTTTPPVSNLTDTDNDGLTDEEETVLGTNINLTDTDADGLTDYDEVKLYNTSATLTDTDGDDLPDYDEVKIYKTDPTIADTDSDGYQDGAEVKSGYNPLGAGKLSDVNN